VREGGVEHAMRRARHLRTHDSIRAGKGAPCMQASGRFQVVRGSRWRAKSNKLQLTTDA
jgi:hypothetical protein